jgi:hypothetical protein
LFESDWMETSCIRLFCISDTHGFLPLSVPESVIVLHAGDMCQQGAPEHIDELREFLLANNHSVRVAFVVDGNHELLHPFRQASVLERVTDVERKSLKLDLTTRLGKSARVLKDEIVEMEGLKLLGLRC